MFDISCGIILAIFCQSQAQNLVAPRASFKLYLLNKFNRARAHTGSCAASQPGKAMNKGATPMALPEIPYIDPNVEHVGVSKLRSLNADTLREMNKTLVLQDNHEPLAVLLKYE